MSKKMLCLLALVVMIAFTSFSFAANHGAAKTVREQANISVPPTRIICLSCLGYGGDLDPNSASANGLASEKDIIVSDAEVVQGVNIPTATAKATALLANFLTFGCTIDPRQADWDVRTGVSNGNGGTIVASGTDTAGISGTGQTAFGLPECSVKVFLGSAVQLSAARYYFGVVPYCNNPNNSTCGGQRFFMSDSPDNPPLNGKGSVPGNQVFFNSTFFGANWQPGQGPSGACAGVGCNRMSLGVIGTR